MVMDSPTFPKIWKTPSGMPVIVSIGSVIRFFANRDRGLGRVAHRLKLQSCQRNPMVGTVRITSIGEKFYQCGGPIVVSQRRIDFTGHAINSENPSSRQTVPTIRPCARRTSAWRSLPMFCSTECFLFDILASFHWSKSNIPSGLMFGVQDTRTE